MKRILSLTLIIFSLLTLLTACGKNKTILYSSADFDKVLTLAEYKGITLDTSSDEFMAFYDNAIISDIKNNNLYVEKTEGTVQNGDIANIDGFESGLIGVEIGKTVDLNLTFPEDYGKEELNGADVVFTVTVNSVQSTNDVEPKDIYKDLGYETLKQYENATKERATEEYFLDLIRSNSEIKEYPKEDIETLNTQIKDALDSNINSYYGMSLEAYITQGRLTMIEFENDLIDNQIKPLIESTMPLYAILDKEGVKVTEKDIEAKLKELVEEYKAAGSTVDADTIKKSAGEYSIENLVVEEKALEIIKENATIK